jgi:hypothetical protein
VSQLPLFDLETALPRRVRRRPAGVYRVLYEPAVAEATARKDRLGCDLKSAFASFWAKLSEEQRAELRGRLAA